MSSPITNCATRRSASRAAAITDRLIALYGSLRDQRVQRQLGLQHRLRRLSACRIEGHLYDLGDYPGLVPGPGVVIGELYGVLDDHALAAMDAFEDFDSARPRNSLYLRTWRRLQRPAVDCWVYLYNGSVAGRPRVPGGDWLRYRRGA